MGNRSSCPLYMSDRPRPRFVSSNNEVFGNKCPTAKDAPNVIDNGEVALDFPPEANISDITTSSVDSILDHTDTHYILQMTDDSVKSFRNHCLFPLLSDRRIHHGHRKMHSL